MHDNRNVRQMLKKFNKEKTDRKFLFMQWLRSVYPYHPGERSKSSRKLYCLRYSLSCVNLAHTITTCIYRDHWMHKSSKVRTKTQVEKKVPRNQTFWKLWKEWFFETRNNLTGFQLNYQIPEVLFVSTWLGTCLVGTMFFHKFSE